MRLSQMQDIGGCRAVLKSMANVRKLVARYKGGSFGHILRGEKDYISSPKADGYRCHHLVYEYRGKSHKSCYDGLKVEIQLRTQFQHAWATAVEAVGIFTRQALKSNQGDQDWRRFFSLMGAVVAAIEGCPAVPNTPLEVQPLSSELRALCEKLKVFDVLSAYSATIRYVNQIRDAKYFLIRLNTNSMEIAVRRFSEKESQEANRLYTEAERSAPDGVQVVLVSVDSLVALKRAYPNYFLDTTRFSELVKRAAKGDFPRPISNTPMAA